MEPVVTIRDLVKVYDPLPLWMRALVRTYSDHSVRALDGISFDVYPGKICAVVGPNGAGKSTLFRILTGLTTPTEGTATILGHDVSKESERIRRDVGFMPSDDRSLYLRLTCAQNLTFHGRLQGLAKQDLQRRIDEVLEQVELTHARDRVGFALSSGMRARLQLARAMLHEPKVLILDEPTGAIDPVSAHRLLGLIERLTHEQQLAVLLSSHRLEEVDALHDNVAFLDHGSLLHWGDIYSLRSTWEQRRISLTFSSDEAARAASSRLGEFASVEEISCLGAVLTVTTEWSLGQMLLKIDDLLPDLLTMEEARLPLRDLFTLLIDGRKEVADP